MSMTLTSPVHAAQSKRSRVRICSRHETPELPLLEEAAGQLAGFDEEQLLPAAAVDVECAWGLDETPGTTVPASPQDEDDYLSVATDAQSSEDEAPEKPVSLTPWPHEPAPCNRLVVKNTFLDLEEQSNQTLAASRSRALSESSGLLDLAVRGVEEVSVSSFYGATANDSDWMATAVERHMFEPEAVCVQMAPMWCNVIMDDDGCVTQVVPFAHADASEVNESTFWVDPCCLCIPQGEFEWSAEPGEVAEANEVPAAADPAETEPAETCSARQPPTTLVLRHLPADLLQEDLLEVLDREEFSGLYDFVYLPDCASEDRVAVLNLTEHAHGEQLKEKFEGRTSWGGMVSERACAVTWSELQGLDELAATYRDTTGAEMFKGGWPVPLSEHVLSSNCDAA